MVVDEYLETNLANLGVDALRNQAATNLASYAIDSPQHLLSVAVLVCNTIFQVVDNTYSNNDYPLPITFITDLLSVVSTISFSTVNVPNMLLGHEDRIKLLVRLASLGKRTPQVADQAMTVLFNFTRSRNTQVLAMLRSNVELVRLLQNEKLFGQLIAVMSLANMACEAPQHRNWRLCSPDMFFELTDLLKYILTDNDSNWNLNEPLLALRYLLLEQPSLTVANDDDAYSEAFVLLISALQHAYRTNDEYCIDLATRCLLLLSSSTPERWTPSHRRVINSLPLASRIEFQNLLCSANSKLPAMLTLISAHTVRRLSYLDGCIIRRLPIEMFRLVFEMM